jgi:hypothetical protein
MVNAGFDVTVFDSISELAPTPSAEGMRVVVLDISGSATLSTLRALVAADPVLRVLAWTGLEVSAAEELLGQIGVAYFAVCTNTATPTEIVDCTRRLVGG